MGATTKFTAEESAQAFNYMAMAGWKTDDMLNGIEGILSLAAASGEDLATTSDIVTDALTAFNMKAGDAGHFSDVLAAAASTIPSSTSPPARCRSAVSEKAAWDAIMEKKDLNASHIREA